MKLPELHQFERIEIRWIDAQSPAVASWFTDDEYKDWLSKRHQFKQIGYFVEYTKDYLCICGGYSLNEKEEVTQTNAITIIPIGCVKNIARLKLVG